MNSVGRADGVDVRATTQDEILAGAKKKKKKVSGYTVQTDRQTGEEDHYPVKAEQNAFRLRVWLHIHSSGCLHQRNRATTSNYYSTISFLQVTIVA